MVSEQARGRRTGSDSERCCASTESRIHLQKKRGVFLNVQQYLEIANVGSICRKEWQESGHSISVGSLDIRRPKQFLEIESYYVEHFIRSLEEFLETEALWRS